MDWFVFQGRLDRVVDGDTIDLIVDQGFRGRHEVRVRLTDVDTAEIYGVPDESDEFERGMEQKTFVEDWFDVHETATKWPFVLDSQKDSGKYGRWPGEVIAKDDETALTEALVEAFPEVAD